MVHREGIPLSLAVYSSSPAKVRLIELMPTHRLLVRLPSRLVYERAANFDRLRQRLVEKGMELGEGGQKLKAYKRRWRHEYRFETYLAFTQLACLLITPKTCPANQGCLVGLVLMRVLLLAALIDIYAEKLPS